MVAKGLLSFVQRDASVAADISSKGLDLTETRNRAWKVSGTQGKLPYSTARVTKGISQTFLQLGVLITLLFVNIYFLPLSWIPRN